MAKSLKRNSECAELSNPEHKKKKKKKSEEALMNSCLSEYINQAKKLLDESNSLDLQFLKCEIRHARTCCVIYMYKYYPSTNVFNLGCVLFFLNTPNDSGEMASFESFDLKLFQREKRGFTEFEIQRGYSNYEENWNLIVSADDEVSYRDETKHLSSCLRPSFEVHKNAPVYNGQVEGGDLICPFCGASTDIRFE